MINSNRYSRVAFLALFIILSFILTAFSPSSGVAYASDGGDGVVNFDNTDVLDDLEGSALNGVPFDVEDYPYDKNGEVSFLGFVEYGYSDYVNLRDKYGLYIYIYNPALVDISANSSRVEMAVEFNAEGTPTKYDKFKLQLCSVSEGMEANRFWKFKVVGGETFAEKVNPAARTYYVSGVEVWTYGDKLPFEVPIKTAYTWTGFAEGFGSTDEQIRCTAEMFETIDLEVQHTTYITGMSSLGNGHYNQVHTAYFAVPNRFFDEYGRLQKIFAEWFEYKLKDILVTANPQLYNYVSLYSGYKLSGDKDESVPFSFWYGKTRTSSGLAAMTTYEWAYNIDEWSDTYFGMDGMHLDEGRVLENAYMIPLVFLRAVEDPYEIFEFFNKYYKTAGGVLSSELLDEIYAYSNNLGNGYVEPVGKKVSADLFFDYVDDGRTRGFQQKEVDFGDTFELDSYNSTHDWWDRLIDFGFFGTPEDIDVDMTVMPIYDVAAADLSGKDADVASRLLINEKDVADFRAFYDENAATNHIILFRFAHTDYMARPAGYTLNDDSKSEDSTDAYVCSETVFFNFDIISLTFNDDGEYRTFAVVSDPIDIVGSLEPPADAELPEKLEDFSQAVKDVLERAKEWFESVGEWFKSAGEWTKNNWKWIVLVVGVIALIIVVSLFIKFFGLFTGGKTKVRIEMPKESGTVQNARKKKVGKTISSKKKK